MLSVKKSNKHFISNEIVEVTSEDLDISDNTLNNNLNKDINTVNEEDLGNVQSMLCSPENERYETKRDESSGIQHVFSNVGRIYSAESRPVDEYIHSSSSSEECNKYHADPDWRRKMGTYKMSNKGDGSHRLIIQNMKEGNDDVDRKLIALFEKVIAPEDETHTSEEWTGDSDSVNQEISVTKNVSVDLDHNYNTSLGDVATNGNQKQHTDDSTNKDDSVLNVFKDHGVIDLSGQYIHDPSTGAIYNIDDIDISQFTEIYLVDAPQQQESPVLTKVNRLQCEPVAEQQEAAVQETNYTLKLIVESEDDLLGDIEIKEEKESDDNGRVTKEGEDEGSVTKEGGDKGSVTKEGGDEGSVTKEYGTGMEMIKSWLEKSKVHSVEIGANDILLTDKRSTSSSASVSCTGETSDTTASSTSNTTTDGSSDEEESVR